MSDPKFFVNFEAALKQLTQFKKQYDGSDIHRAGVIQKKAGAEGLIIASPKKALEWANAF